MNATRRKLMLLVTTILAGIREARATITDANGNPINVTGATQTFTGLNVSGSGGSPTLTLTSVPASGNNTSPVAIAFSYTVAAPGGLTAVWNPGAVSGTVTAFTASGGTGSANIATPSVTGTYTLSVTGTGANTATAVAPNTTVISSSTGVPIPGASNRPVYNTTTQQLTWSGPLGGGPSNGTYTVQTRTLTQQTGAITTTSNGQVIQGLALTGNATLDNGVITIAHNNVTIKQCYIKEATTDQGDRYTIHVNPGTSGTIIEDCEIDGNARNGPGNTACVSGSNAAASNVTMRRNNCTRSEQALRFTLNNCNFTENWCNLIGGQDADWFEVYPNGGSCNNLLVQYNLFDGTDNTAGGADSGINMTTASGLPAGNIGPNILCDSNWFTNWPTVHALVFDNSGGGTLQYGFTNNGFFNCLSNFTPVGGTCSPNSGNYFMATATSTSGTPVNGNGKV